MALEDETLPRVARLLLVPSIADGTLRLQLKTLRQSCFAKRAMWQTRRLFFAEGYARS